MTMKNSKSDLVNVVNMKGKVISVTERYKAIRSVGSNRSEWVDNNTIRLKIKKKKERTLKKQAWERDNYTCYLCDEKMYLGHPELTVDHVVPRRLGGSILLDNIKTCCRDCNQHKGHRTYNQYFIQLYCGLYFLILLYNNRKG